MSGLHTNSLPMGSFAAGATDSTDVAAYAYPQLEDTAMSSSSTPPDFGFANGLSSELGSLSSGRRSMRSRICEKMGSLAWG